jgi:hypothetical protein
LDAFFFNSKILFNVLLALVILYAYIKTKNIGYLLFLIPLFILPFLVVHPLKSTLVNETKFYFANRNALSGDDLIRLSEKMHYHRNALKIIFYKKHNAISVATYGKYIYIFSNNEEKSCV